MFVPSASHGQDSDSVEDNAAVAPAGRGDHQPGAGLTSHPGVATRGGHSSVGVAGGRPGAGHPGAPGLVPQLVTRAGRRAVVVSVGLELFASVAAAVFFVALARLVAGTPGPGTVVVTVVAGASHLVARVTAQWICRTSAIGEEEPLRERLLERWWHSASAAHDRARSGATIALFTDSVERFTQYRQGFVGRQLASGIAPLCVLAVLAVAVDPIIAVILAVAVPLVPWVIKRFGALSRTAATRSRQLRARLASQYLESIQGLETLTVHNAAGRVAGELAQAGENSRRATMAVLARNQLVLFVSDAVFSLAMVTLSAGLAAWRLGSAAITPPGAVAVVLCSVLLLAPLDVVASSFYVGMAGRGAQRVLQRFLAPARPEQDGAGRGSAPKRPDQAPHPVHEDAPGTPSIEVRGATLGYPGKVVLRDVEFDVPRGGRAVVLGPSGAGKSTLLRTLKGDLLPSSGEVVLDGLRLDASSQDRIRASSALVAQSTWLFTGSVRDNLTLVRADASDDELWAALELVDLAGFVRGMPHGLDSPVGERGQALSGGQAQRISLARAFLSGRQLLLLDEPTSQVDLFSEQVIMAALDRLAADHTIVLVTHRMSAASGASAVWSASAQTLHRMDAHNV